jgi:hypothetical protein
MKDWSGCLVEGVPQLSCLEVLFNNLIVALGGLVFIILFAMFALGAIRWLTAGDDANKLKKAQGTFFSAVLGLVILSSAYLILFLLETVLGVELTLFKIPVN